MWAGKRLPKPKPGEQAGSYIPGSPNHGVCRSISLQAGIALIGEPVGLDVPPDSAS